MKTEEEIAAKIDQEIAARPELAGLSSSNAAEWKLWKYVYLHATLSLIFYWEKFKAEVLGIVNSGRIGRPDYYVTKSLEFQFGDPLVNDNGVIKYQTIDVTKRIITQAAADTSAKQVVLKVATANGVLTTEQRAAFTDYWEDLKPFTIPLQVVSELPDVVKLNLTIYFDGKLIQADVEAALNTAITGYLTTGLAFNGAFNVNVFRDSLRTALRDLSTENDVLIQQVHIRSAIGQFVAVNYKYTPLSGRYRYASPNDGVVSDRSTIIYERI